ncbi:MAG: DNA polymerase III subunit gamma/tau [Ignavibacteriales bacterium]
MSSYLVLARKWRPKTFDDLIGQPYITRALKNAVSTEKIAHAIILSGPRGVGKTTTARIVAKALNCEKGPTPEPCSICVFCKEISEGKSLDVSEIDAASHTGVNDVREIIENIKYVPSSGKTKIYIIDEAHMLSQAAFNALLKTLEEPPPRVLFILATTEAHKIPATILSRCQRYDFKKVSTSKIKERIEFITHSEGIKIADETLYLIAQEADGSLRDALSILDQLVATFGMEIKHEEASRILGISDKSLVRFALEAVFNKNPKRCIEILNEAGEKGVSPKRFAEDLLKIIRNALLIRTCGREIVSDLSDEEKKEIERISTDQSIESIEMIFKFMLEGAEGVQKSFYPRMTLEATLVKLSILHTIVPIDDILSKLEKLSEKIGVGASSSFKYQEGETQKSPEEKKRTSALDEKPSSGSSFDDIPTSSEVSPSDSSNSDWGDFVRFVKSKKPITAMHLEQAGKIRFANGILEIEFTSSSIHSDYLSRQDAQENLRKLSKEFFKQDLKVRVEVKSSSTEETSYQSLKERNAKNREEVQEDPVVQDVVRILGGRVVEVKKFKE